MLKHFLSGFTQLLDSRLLNSSINLQITRWRRKPRWLPVAKSKLFRVPKHKPQDTDEKLELLRLHNIYRTQLRSVISYLHKEAEINRKTSTADHLVLTPEQEENEFQKCVTMNNEWNQKIAKEREIRLQGEAVLRKQYVAKKLEEGRLREEERRTKVEELVKMEKERSKSYITRENLDAAIEHALANPVDHNFAIDLQGNMYIGRYATPEKEVEKTASIVEVNV